MKSCSISERKKPGASRAFCFGQQAGSSDPASLFYQGVTLFQPLPVVLP